MNLTKLFITTAAATLLFGAIAAQPSLFAGVALGYGQLNNGQDDTDNLPGVTVKLTGVTYSINAGYNFSNYFGTEGQVNRDPSYELKVSGAEGGSGTEKLYDIDILADGYLPINNDYFGSN